MTAGTDDTGTEIGRDENARALGLVESLLALGCFPSSVSVGDVTIHFGSFQPPRERDDRPRPPRHRSYSAQLESIHRAAARGDES